MKTYQNWLRVGASALLALQLVQSQTGNTSPPPAKDSATTKKDAAKKATDEAAAKKAAAKKAAEDKAAADKKAADEAAAKKAAGAKPTDTAASAPVAATTTGPWHVSVTQVASDQLSLDVLSLNDNSIPGTACATKDLECKRLHLVLTDAIVKDQLKQLHTGDHVQVVYSTDAAKNQNVLKALSVDSVPGSARIWVILGSALICGLLYCLFTGFKPQQTIIGEDNRYSNSRFQMALWFFVLITTYIAMLWLRVWAAGWDFAGGVNIPKNLLLLSGMSALTYAGAKGITSSKTPPTSASPTNSAGQKTRSTKPNFFFDLTHNDGVPAAPPTSPALAAVAVPAAAAPAAVAAVVDAAAAAPAAPAAVVDAAVAAPAAPVAAAAPAAVVVAAVAAPVPALVPAPAVAPVQGQATVDPNDPTQYAVTPQFDFGDFQMVIVTLIAVVTYIGLIYIFFGSVEYSKIVSLPDVDTTLLAAFGLGQGAYLTKKAVGNVGTS